VLGSYNVWMQSVYALSCAMILPVPLVLIPHSLQSSIAIIQLAFVQNSLKYR